MNNALTGIAQRLWCAWWLRAGANGDPLGLFREIDIRYSEPHRRYHTLEHIVFCIRRFRELRRLSKCPACIEAALWYHDIVYVPGRADNEEKSAAIARARLNEMGFGPDCEKAVEELIISTRHEASGQDIDNNITQDVDLAILGTSRKKFHVYESRIRAEFSGIPEEEFKIRRGQFLRKILAREHIFNTDLFRAKYEKAARGNVAALAGLYGQH